MSQEKPSAPDEQTQPGPDPQELALRAAVATRVLAFWKDLCQPVINANKAYIESNPGVLTTVAKMEGERVASFTESLKQPFFEVDDDDAFLQWADEKGETDWVVKESFKKAILERRARWLNGECVDSVTGEVIPGVTRNAGGTHISVKPTFTEAGKERIDSLLTELFGKTAAAVPMLAPATTDDVAEGSV
jgi:hypothetical protein